MPAIYQMNIFTDSIRADGEYRQLKKELLASLRDKERAFSVSGLCEGATDIFYSAITGDLKEKYGDAVFLLISPDEKEAVRLRDLLTSFGLRTAFYTVRDLNFNNITASHEYEHERLRVLFGIEQGDIDVIITTPDGALGYTIPPEKLTERIIKLDMSSVISPRNLSATLCDAGYCRVDMVEGSGQFAVRGGIIDIFPPYAKYKFADSEEGERAGGKANPFRIELFGDDIDRMSIFDISTQRSIANVTEALFPPAREVIADAQVCREISSAISLQIKKTKKPEPLATLKEELAAVNAAIASVGTENGSDIRFIDKYISLVYPQKCCLLDYLPTKTVVLVHSTTGVADRLKAAAWHSDRTIEELMEGGTLAGKYAEFSRGQSALDLLYENRTTLFVSPMARGITGKTLGGLFAFRTKHITSYFDNFELLCEDLSSYIRADYKVLIAVDNKTEAANLTSILTERGVKAYAETDSGEFTIQSLPKGCILIKVCKMLRGFELVTPKIAVLSDTYDRRGGMTAAAIKRKSAAKNAKRRILSYNDIEIGDYIVHETHGIGQYMGIENLNIQGVSRDYISIKYAGTDHLYLPVEKLDMISKYIGARTEDGEVKLSRFGGTEWGRVKSRAKAAAKDMAKELIALYAARLRRAGFAFPPDDDFQHDFESAFEYEETDSQLVSIEEIKNDMQKTVPMDRILCGDVGFGKTEVAFRAAYKAVLAGKQVAILVPTTILALQHYQTATSRMRNYAVNIDMLSRFRTDKQQAQTLRRLERGDIDIIIGTHRLISKDVVFKNLGLLIVDEEQRFGVAQKERLKAVSDNNNIDVLTLTATPIPRTLNMAMGGLRDISILDEAPGERLPVQTYVLEADDLIILDAIKRELRRGGQVFYMHNFIESIKSVAAKISANIPEARVTVAHGRMEKEELEEIWGAMLRGEIDVLVSTSIIETGIDIPNANTLIVDNAHRLGLSQLHQLRGRVGRSPRRAYAYFTYPPDMVLSEISEKRLNAIREYAEFGAGFKIALRDMELRGAGNMLGAEQSGHLDAVGYELFIKLLNDAVLEEKGEKPVEKIDCTVNFTCDAYLPEDYVRYPTQRIALYKRIALIETEADADDIADELSDRYGELPTAADNLLRIALVRASAIKCGIKNINQSGGEISVFPEHIDIETWYEISDKFPDRIKLVMTGEPHITVKMKRNENALSLVNRMFEKYIEIMLSRKKS